MSGNSFGKIFKITSAGESHGPVVSVIIDGCPAGLKLSADDIQKDLSRRRPGQNSLTTSRSEKDEVQILSGLKDGVTLGTPILLMIQNKDVLSKNYDNLKNTFRPSHADYTYQIKYGLRDWRGGGRASARETIARVAAGAIAKKILAKEKIKITGYVTQIGLIKSEKIVLSQVEKNDLRLADPSKIKKAIKLIEDLKAKRDSVGGVVEITISNVPPGLGEPVFDKLSSELAKAIMSIPAVKGFEIGDGFSCAEKTGSANNDELIKVSNKIKTKTNHAGGIVGGISNGEDIVLRFALKPVASIGKEQNTVDLKGKKTKLKIEGRHDPCVCPRAVPIGEAMVALVIVDHLFLNKSSKI